MAVVAKGERICWGPWISSTRLGYAYPEADESSPWQHWITDLGRFAPTEKIGQADFQEPAPARADDPQIISLHLLVDLWEKWSFSSESILGNIWRLFKSLVCQGVRIRQLRNTYEYLRQFPEMMDVVERAVSLARSRLPEAQLQLEVYQDPENEDEHLVLYARFPRYDASTMERIRLVRALYRPLLSGKSGWFLLTTDFRPPE